MNMMMESMVPEVPPSAKMLSFSPGTPFYLWCLSHCSSYNSALRSHFWFVFCSALVTFVSSVSFPPSLGNGAILILVKHFYIISFAVLAATYLQSKFYASLTFRILHSLTQSTGSLCATAFCRCGTLPIFIF